MTMAYMTQAFDRQPNLTQEKMLSIVLGKTIESYDESNCQCEACRTTPKYQRKTDLLIRTSATVREVWPQFEATKRKQATAEPYQPGSTKAITVGEMAFAMIVDNPAITDEGIMELFVTNYRNAMSREWPKRPSCQCPDCIGKTTEEADNHLLARVAATIRDMEPELKLVRLIEKDRQDLMTWTDFLAAT